MQRVHRYRERNVTRSCRTSRVPDNDAVSMSARSASASTPSWSPAGSSWWLAEAQPVANDASKSKVYRPVEEMACNMLGPHANQFRLVAHVFMHGLWRQNICQL